MKNRKSIVIIIILILVLSIGYAILSANLNINGAFTFTENRFHIYLDKNEIINTTIESPSISINENKTAISLEAYFKKPGDYIDFGFYIINDGTIDTIIDRLEITGIDASLENYFNNTIKYIDDINVQQGDYLQAGGVRKIVVHIEYSYDVESLIPINNLSIGINFNFIQPKEVTTTEWNYEYIDQEQYFIVPKTGTYKIELWGSGGGLDIAGGKEGYGGYVSGNISLERLNNLYIYVGHKGARKGSELAFNGGGEGQFSGGDATDIRLVNGNWNDFSSLKSRIMVAGGGGGNDDAMIAGSAGGLIGYNGSGTGGTQTSFGKGYSNGGFGFGGGRKVYSTSGNGGGGSGYYGGGSANTISSFSGAGGSSFISGHAGCDAIDESSTSDNIIHTGQSIHYSGYKFTDTIMIDGNGYKWTTTKGSEVVGMPTHDGKSTMTGNQGNGYAKITYIG